MAKLFKNSLGKIKQTRHFKYVFSFNNKLENDCFKVFFAKPFEEYPMVGIIATKKIGNAVQRNKCRRRIKSAARAITSNKDMIIIPKRKANKSKFMDLELKLTEIIDKIIL